ncbi:Stage V sporulation protein SpoVR/YcgB, involved in spore cortex formation [Amphritea atlantica]|uniref:Stage V sporulation protein SpoVR/YcgB, involved in spore cortex formation n=1 Tax=Amphritea atlantica TaxID=355243 RepID=A0A1H9JHI1_9GAMM|nr:SpoVR family protein [Amphritea atlantica]SEQ86374.1 Stage V sporulation protein SpoVR/YcgB, involved in spore cortex formation [Amphritea atlantica]
MKKHQPISTGSEWTFELIQRYDQEIARVAEHYGLDTYPNQIEIITSEQMMDAYSSVGMPLNYNHWSFGKQFVSTEQQYKRGQMGLAYEIVINSNPCISYLMEENTMTMQALVIAHACYGHNSFFKGNYLFRTWTDASAIIDYLLFAKNYIAKCEERHGVDAVEQMLDACHALMNYGVNRYLRPQPITPEEEKNRLLDREEYIQRHLNQLWNTIPKKDEIKEKKTPRFPKDPEENLLYFIEKNAPLLEPWQREIVRIVRKIAQYYYPQRQTQVMNEGWACFWHYTLLHHLHDEGLVTDGFIMEFLHSHTSVIYQPPFDSPYFSGINPYSLGYGMMRDIRRICENPTDEDRKWFPDIAGSDWNETLQHAMRNYKDESFILQYLSPHMIRELKLFTITDNSALSTLQISAIHDDEGYQKVRENLAASYNIGNREPNIQIYNVNIRGDRSLTLRHYMHNEQPLGDDTDEVLKHLHQLWGFDVHLESVSPDGQIVNERHCPPKPHAEEVA